MNDITLKHAGGRPSKYLEKSQEEWQGLINRYIESAVDYEMEIGRNNKGEPIFKTVVELPMIEGLADELGIDKHTIYAWAEQRDEKDNLIKPEFFHAIRIIKAKQARKLINNSLSGGYNHAISKLLLSANHGIHERQEIDKKISNKDGKPLELVAKETNPIKSLQLIQEIIDDDDDE